MRGNYFEALLIPLPLCNPEIRIALYFSGPFGWDIVSLQLCTHRTNMCTKYTEYYILTTYTHESPCGGNVIIYKMDCLMQGTEVESSCCAVYWEQKGEGKKKRGCSKKGNNGNRLVFRRHHETKKKLREKHSFFKCVQLSFPGVYSRYYQRGRAPLLRVSSIWYPYEKIWARDHDRIDFSFFHLPHPVRTTITNTN